MPSGTKETRRWLAEKRGTEKSLALIVSCGVASVGGRGKAGACDLSTHVRHHKRAQRRRAVVHAHLRVGLGRLRDDDELDYVSWIQCRAQLTRSLVIQIRPVAVSTRFGPSMVAGTRSSTSTTYPGVRSFSPRKMGKALLPCASVLIDIVLSGCGRVGGGERWRKVDILASGIWHLASGTASSVATDWLVPVADATWTPWGNHDV